jgi:hypothetical protein
MLRCRRWILPEVKNGTFYTRTTVRYRRSRTFSVRLRIIARSRAMHNQSLDSPKKNWMSDWRIYWEQPNFRGLPNDVLIDLAVSHMDTKDQGKTKWKCGCAIFRCDCPFVECELCLSTLPSTAMRLETFATAENVKEIARDELGVRNVYLGWEQLRFRSRRLCENCYSDHYAQMLSKGARNLGNTQTPPSKEEIK